MQKAGLVDSTEIREILFYAENLKHVLNNL